MKARRESTHNNQQHAGKRATPITNTDVEKLNACPECGGEADNGHDRELPPNPYVCSKCDGEPVSGNPVLIELAERMHYPDCWDTVAYPTLLDALLEMASCSECRTIPFPKAQPTPADDTLREALLKLAPFELAQGDAVHRVNPASGQVVNSNCAWAVSQGERSAHKIKSAISVINQALSQPAKPAMTRDELEELAYNAAKEASGFPSSRTGINATITALSEAGVLNVRDE